MRVYCIIFDIDVMFEFFMIFFLVKSGGGGVKKTFQVRNILTDHSYILPMLRHICKKKTYYFSTFWAGGGRWYDFDLLTYSNFILSPAALKARDGRLETPPYVRIVVFSRNVASTCIMSWGVLYSFWYWCDVWICAAQFDCIMHHVASLVWNQSCPKIWRGSNLDLCDLFGLISQKRCMLWPLFI